MTSRELNAKVSYYVSYNGYSKAYLASLCGMSLTTFYTKLRNPKKFSVEEIAKLAKALKLSDQDKLKLLVA